jgi:hypothetical protein
VQIHGPSSEFAAADVTVELNATRPEDPFITIMWPNGVRVYLDDGDADYLIKVILQAKDMLAAHRNAVACHAGIGEYVNGDTAAPGTGKIHSSAGWDPSACAECGSREGTVVDGWHPECRRYREGLPVAEDDGGDGDDNREPYCTWCGFTLDAAGRHLYPDDVIPDLHETELGWREPVGVPSGEDAQAAEVRRIGKLHTDGHITDAECQQMVDKVLFPHAALAGEQTAHDLGTDR